MIDDLKNKECWMNKWPSEIHMLEPQKLETRKASHLSSPRVQCLSTYISQNTYCKLYVNTYILGISRDHVAHITCFWTRASVNSATRYLPFWCWCCGNRTFRLGKSHLVYTSGILIDCTILFCRPSCLWYVSVVRSWERCLLVILMNYKGCAGLLRNPFQLYL